VGTQARAYEPLLVSPQATIIAQSVKKPEEPFLFLIPEKNKDLKKYINT
jgi:hypothetical protein